MQRTSERIGRLLLQFTLALFATGAMAEPRSPLTEQALERFLQGEVRQAETLAAESVKASGDPLALALQARILAYRKDFRAGYTKAQEAITAAPEDGLVIGLALTNFTFGWKADGSSLASESRTYAQKVLSLLPSPRRGDESYARALALFALGQREEALSEAQRGAALSPDSAMHHRLVGNFSENLKQYREAEAAYLQALSHNPHFAAVKADLGYLYLDRIKDAGRAQTEFQEGLKLDPNEVEILFALGDLSMRQDKPVEAIRYFDNVLALNPNYLNALYQRALAHRRLANIDKAVADLRKFRDLAPSDKKAEAMELAGDLRFSQKNWSEAVDFYRSAENYDSTRTSHLLQRAQAYLNTEQLDKALDDLRRASVAYPDQGDVFFYIGWILSEKKDVDGAIEAYGKSIEKDSTKSGALRNRGALYLQEKGRPDLAESDFDRAVQVNPTSVLNRFYRADLYEATGRSNLAKVELKKAQELPDFDQYKDRTRQLYPAVTFDEVAARAALEPGTGTIQGNAATRTGLFSKVKASEVTVTLYPITPYVQAWLDLRASKESKTTRVQMSSMARQYCLTAKTNSKGEFEFRNLKPGRYFAQAEFSFTEHSVEKVIVGEGYDEDYDEYYDIYENRDVYTQHADRLEGTVTIEGEGQVVKMSMRQNT